MAIFSHSGEGQGVIDLSEHGFVYSINLRAGKIIALLWPRDAGPGNASMPKLAEVDLQPGSQPVVMSSLQVYKFPGVEAPHDMVLTGAEGVACKGATCVYIGETRLTDAQEPSGLHSVCPYSHACSLTTT